MIAAYVSKNVVQRGDLPALIASVHTAFASLAKPVPSESEKPTPRTPIRKTVTPDHLISLEDGKPYRTLKRHLGRLGLTPGEYRAKWSLPTDYPPYTDTGTAAPWERPSDYLPKFWRGFADEADFETT